MATRHVQGHLQWLAFGAHYPEMGDHAVLAHVLRTQVRILAKAVANHLTVDPGQQLAHHRIIHTHHRHAVERQVVEELDKSVLQLGEVAAVGVHVVRIDIGDDGAHGLQVQEAGIGFIRFRHQITALPQTCIGASAIQAPANNKRRIQSGLGHDRCSQ